MKMPCRISFDLDGTLLCDTKMTLADPALPPLIGPYGFCEDRLRMGATGLLKGLVADGYEIWIYTQSLRGRSEIKRWFDALGVPLAGYVNLPLHETACVERGIVGKRPLKCPHWFGIAVHVDDDEQVAHECKDTECRVILVSHDETDIEACVRDELG